MVNGLAAITRKSEEGNNSSHGALTVGQEPHNSANHNK